MKNLKSRTVFLAVTLAIPASFSTAQQVTTGDVKTAGNCSPVVIQPKDGFQIICHDNSLTRDEALKQAKQISELLSRLRATSQDNSEFSKKLDQILQQIGDMKAATLAVNENWRWKELQPITSQ